ncbi:MAG: response regulator [Gemmatimonadaceae bacterium]
MIIRRAGLPDHQEVILIVDDVPRNVELLKAMLAQDGFLFLTARSGAEALAVIAEQRPDLVLLDILMPDMDGHEVARIIKADAATSNIPLIMITALDDRKSRLASLDAGAEDFLTKPVDRAELRARVRNLLRIKALSDYSDKHSQELESEVRSRTRELVGSETALLKERDAAQRYLDNAQVILLALDLEGRITLVNQYAYEMLGWSAEELIGRSWVDCCLPEHTREEMRAKFQTIVSGDLPVTAAMLGKLGTIENPVIDRTGRERLIEWRSTLLRDDMGTVIGTFSSGTDITARIDAIAKLATAEERMRFALVNANVGIWDVDASDGSVRWSETLEAQYGLAPGTFPGTLAAFIERVHPEDRDAVLETITASAQSGGNFDFQHRALHPDGSFLWLHSTGQSQLDETGAPLRAVGISQDITAHHTMERRYLQSQKMEAVGQLASGVAHDFNNLLTVITGFAEFVAASLPDKSQSGDDVAEIIKAADRAAALTQQLLAFSRQQVLHMAPVDMNDLITGMSGMIRRLIGEDITVDLVLDHSVRLALADRGQVEQVLMNLVVNARDAMPGGGSIVIETADAELENSPFHEEPVEAGSYVMLAVTDTGTGMSRETQKRLFEPFFTTKKAGEGTGLGLSTSYGIVKQSNGHIWVYSELGVGTTLKVYLPRSPDAPPLALPQAPSASAVAITETVLLVEDESSVRVLATRILREAGYRVLIAANGADAQSQFDRNESLIDLVLTDVVMPGVGGPELLARLHACNPTLPVLYMSGYTEQSIATRVGLDRGIPFLPKPFTAAELLRSVRSALDNTRSPT